MNDNLKNTNAKNGQENLKGVTKQIRPPVIHHTKNINLPDSSQSKPEENLKIVPAIRIFTAPADSSENSNDSQNLQKPESMTSHTNNHNAKVITQPAVMPVSEQPKTLARKPKPVKFKKPKNQKPAKEKKYNKNKFKQWIQSKKQKRLENTKPSKISVFNRYVTNTLNQKKKLRIEWILIGLISLILIAFFGTILGIMQRFIGLSAPRYPAVANAQSYNHVMRIISIFCFVLLIVPYFYVMAAFFSGINQIHKSKSVHYIIWFTLIVNMLFVIVVCILLIVGYYGLDGYNLVRNLS
ncbi:MPN157 family protein [[Mycoplasma] testudinis]|uniref:MPN157 family protein n=1 Tax=[Mycoplasma] testudinis TaxID=33924 RepID=UPI000A48F03A|nr:hypothetical protein [[Mycoplasma] testudinis]